MTLCTLDLLYYTLAKRVATDKAIAIFMPMFVIKVTEIENKHLQRHAVNLIDNLKPLLSTYLKEHNLTSIAPIVKSLEQVHIINE